MLEMYMDMAPDKRIIFKFPKLRLNEVKIKLLTEALSSGIKS